MKSKQTTERKPNKQTHRWQGTKGRLPEERITGRWVRTVRGNERCEPPVVK